MELDVQQRRKKSRYKIKRMGEEGKGETVKGQKRWKKVTDVEGGPYPNKQLFSFFSFFSSSSLSSNPTKLSKRVFLKAPSSSSSRNMYVQRIHREIGARREECRAFALMSIPHRRRRQREMGVGCQPPERGGLFCFLWKFIKPFFLLF